MYVCQCALQLLYHYYARLNLANAKGAVERLRPRASEAQRAEVATALKQCEMELKSALNAREESQRDQGSQVDGGY